MEKDGEAQDSSTIRLGRHLLGVALGGPGAIAFLGQLNDRMDFSSILTRIVVNFQIVSRGFWRLLLHIAHIEVNFDVDALTVFCVLVVPVLLQKKTIELSTHPQFYKNLSVSLTYIMLVGSMPFLKISTLISFSATFLFFWYATEEMVTLAEAPRFRILLASSLAFIILLFANSPVPVGDHIWAVVVFVTMYFVVPSIRRGAPGPLYIAALAFGTYSIDWGTRIAKPAIEQWLTSLGA